MGSDEKVLRPLTHVYCVSPLSSSSPSSFLVKKSSSEPQNYSWFFNKKANLSPCCAGWCLPQGLHLAMALVSLALTAGGAGSRQGAVSTPTHWADMLGRCFSPRACLLLGQSWFPSRPWVGDVRYYLGVRLPDGCVQPSDGAGPGPPLNIALSRPTQCLEVIRHVHFQLSRPCVAEGASRARRGPRSPAPKGPGPSHPPCGRLHPAKPSRSTLLVETTFVLEVLKDQ